MNNVQVEDSQVIDLFAALDEKNRSNILFKALKKGAEHLRDQTKIQLRTKLPNSASMEKGVRLKPDKAYSEISVHIMGDYRLKWFEKGTKLRKTKGHKVAGYEGRHLKRTGKGGNRGKIDSLHFFRDARQKNIDDIISKSITEQLKQI